MKGNARFLLLGFTLLLLLFVSCREEDEKITPVPPAPTSVASVEIQPPVSADPVAVDSAVYRYDQFKDMPYRTLLPKNYDPEKRYPLLLFLHGIGERGNDNEKQLTWGASLFQTDSIRDHYPAIVIFPQCKVGYYWFDKWGLETLKGLLDTSRQKYKIDDDGIYVGGLSMGAYGTYAMVARYPGLFVRAIAISGDGDVNKASAMKDTKWRIFAGKKDHVVPSNKSIKMAEALKRSGANVLLTLYPEADHTESWIAAFSEPDFCSWIFAGSPEGGKKPGDKPKEKSNG